MDKIQDKDTRYYIDLDLENERIVGWDHGSRFKLKDEEPSDPIVRIYITKGQYNKLLGKR